jgi:biotin operon repressor
MLDTGLVRSRAELARALGCSRAWVTKVLGSAARKAQ